MSKLTGMDRAMLELFKRTPIGEDGWAGVVPSLFGLFGEVSDGIFACRTTEEGNLQVRLTVEGRTLAKWL